MASSALSPSAMRRSVPGGAAATAAASLHSDGARGSGVTGGGAGLSNDELWSELNLDDLLNSVKQQQSAAWPLGVGRGGGADALGPGKKPKVRCFEDS